MKTNRHPNRQECYKYLKEYKTPVHVIGHCKSVAAVAYRIARALNRCGDNLDLDLILAAGLLHDIARVEEEHWNVGADFARKRWLFQEADIIKEHMRHEFSKDAYHLTETDLVCLGDRLSLEDKYVGLDKRMDYIVNKAIIRGNRNAVPYILMRKEATRKLLDDIEHRIGCTLDELMAGIDYENEEANNA